MQPELKQQIGQFYESIKPFIESLAVCRLGTDTLYRTCLVASVVKSYEFNAMAASNEREELAFFYIPTLRSICEDIIVLSFLSCLTEAESNEVIQLLFGQELAQDLKTQQDYFRKTRPFQRVLGSEALTAAGAEASEKLKLIAASHGWKLIGKKTFPSISWMAKQCGLDELYDYIYHITSDWVHFNPGTLMRMGWGETDKEARFSTRNFCQYYQAFAVVYGTHLFCLILQSFPAHISLDEDTKGTVKLIKYLLSIEPRWPEIVTFEEMNMPKPKMGILEMLSLSHQRLGGFS